jgi:AcrR family transcriptional regulator
MTAKTPNKHELKTKETRALLLAAAETIFVRDGYEGAELGEVAALAGRTKGAIYAQFKSKEDIFLALVESRSNCYREQMKALLERSTTIEGNIAALRNFYLKLAEDRAWSILLLEFKLFATRHPSAKQRLQNLYGNLLSLDDEARYASYLGEAPKGKDAISRVVMVQVMQPMISGLVLETHLQTNLAAKGVVAKITGRLFDSLIGDDGSQAQKTTKDSRQRSTADAPARKDDRQR